MKDIKNFEGLYAITSCGKVWSYKNNKFLTPIKCQNGYLQVSLCKDGEPKVFLIHRLVAEAYILNVNNFETVDHIDGNRENNCIGNLQWMTNEDNVRKAQNKKVRCVELNKIFESRTAAAKELGLRQSHISECVNGKRKTTGGYHFEEVS